MYPISEINEGDQFKNNRFSSIAWVVIAKKDGLVQIQACSERNGSSVGEPIWKRPSDPVFGIKVFDIGRFTGRSTVGGGRC